MFFTQSCLKKYQELKPELSCLWKNQELSRMEKIIRMEGAGKKLSGSPALVPQLPTRHNDKILKMHILLFKILMNLSIYVFMYTYYKMNVTYIHCKWRFHITFTILIFWPLLRNDYDHKCGQVSWYREIFVFTCFFFWRGVESGNFTLLQLVSFTICTLFNFKKT